MLYLGSRDVRTVFWFAAIPGAVAVLVVIFGVRETRREPAPDSTVARDGSALPGRSLVRFLLPLGLFTLGNASDVFLLLKAGATRAPLYTLPLLWMALHVVKVGTSLVGGDLGAVAGSPALVILLILLLLALSVLLSVVRIVFWLQPMAKAIAGSISVVNPETFETLAQSRQEMPGRGEGLADTLDVAEVGF